VHLAWPVVGRFRAESLLSRAARLRPDDPEPHYWLGQVGFALRGDDGEWIARRGLDRVLELDPDHRDAWTLWLQLYRDNDDRRRATAALARRTGQYRSDLRRALLLVELHDEHAAALLRSLVRERPDDVEPRALLAQALFQAGSDADGATAYDAALRLASSDTAGILWRQVRGIASPVERAAWSVTPPAERAAFFRLFWARRRPDLREPVNARLGEHFRRLAEAQDLFALRHPNSLWHHSARWRAFARGASARSPEGRGARRALALTEWCPPTAARPAETWTPPTVADLAMGQRSVNVEDGLDDRGRIYLRHGRPSEVYRLTGADGPGEGEIWCYRRGGEVFRVSFLRGTSWFLVGGDMIATPVRPGEYESALALLASDAPSARRPPLSFSFWSVAFRGPDARHTELALVLDSLDGIAELVDAGGATAARDARAGAPLRLTAPPGRYALLVDGARGDAFGTYRGTITLPDHGGDTLSISGLLVAGGDVAPDRDAMLAHAPARLRFAAGRPIRIYAELYGLGRRDGLVRYEARYRVERTDGRLLRVGGRRQRAAIIAFRRDAPHASRAIETLVLDPGRLPRGRYRLVLEVTDDVRAHTVSSASLGFELR
jgi:tetratricopeptide (TPR) repeat protein